MALYTGLDLFGDDIRAERMFDAAECAKTCLSMDGACKAFTFNTNSKVTQGPNCFLKSKEGRADGNAVAISGKFLSSVEPDPRDFTISTIDPTASLFKDVDLPGGDLSTRPAQIGGTAQQCRLTCIDEGRCFAFTYGFVAPAEHASLREGENQVLFRQHLIEALMRINGIDRASAEAAMGSLRRSAVMRPG